MSTPPPDHYQILGVSKDAKLPEIRSAHRKLVLKCHPDKVQDAELKAAKQDEFQRVQQAYEVLSDDTRRSQHDEQAKLFQLRKEMGRGKPTPRSNPFEYEIRTAVPRANSYARAKPSQPSPKVYSSHTPPRSYEDMAYDEPRVATRKSTTTYESAERRRASTRDEERRRTEEDEKERERARQRAEKESRRAAHGEKKKSRDKERRRGTEEKQSWTAGVYMENDDSDDYRYVSRSSEKKSSRHRLDEEIRLREREDAMRAHERPTIKSAPLDPKWDKHMDFAGQYMQAARRKGAPAEGDDFRPAPLRRAETFAAATTTTASYTVRHVTPQFSDDDSPRRSSAHRESRKSAEAAPSRGSRDKPSRERRSPSRDAYIVEPPSPLPTTRKPSLQTHTSAPPGSSYLGREKPGRSQTQDYPRTEATPPLSRAQTFQAGDRSRERSGTSRLKKSIEFSSDESADSDAPPKRRSRTPPPRRAAEPTRYIIDNGRSIPISRHRPEPREIDDERTYPRDRSESPHRSRERPSTSRPHITSERSRGIPIRSATYYTPDAPEPIIHTVRPPKASRDSSHRTSSRGGASPYFGEVKFAPNYGVEHVIYSQHPPDIYRRGSDPSSPERDHYYAHQRGGGREVYA